MVNVSKHQKVQSCFSFFALKKSFWRIIALQKSFCQKWLSRKKVRLQQWKKVSVAFCKKDWIWDNNNLCVAKKIARTKKTTKSKKCLESPFLLEEKIKKKKCNAAEVGRLSRIYSCLLFSCLHKRWQKVLRSFVFEAAPNRKNTCFSPNSFSFLSLPFHLLNVRRAIHTSIFRGFQNEFLDQS